MIAGQRVGDLCAIGRNLSRTQSSDNSLIVRKLEPKGVGGHPDLMHETCYVSQNKKSRFSNFFTSSKPHTLLYNKSKKVTSCLYTTRIFQWKHKNLEKLCVRVCAERGAFVLIKKEYDEE